MFAARNAAPAEDDRRRLFDRPPQQSLATMARWLMHGRHPDSWMMFRYPRWPLWTFLSGTLA